MPRASADGALTAVTPTTATVAKIAKVFFMLFSSIENLGVLTPRFSNGCTELSHSRDENNFAACFFSRIRFLNRRALPPVASSGESLPGRGTQSFLLITSRVSQCGKRFLNQLAAAWT
jgi:hypothetical protein